MKLFTANTREKEFVSNEDFHWCNNGEILIFAPFQATDGGDVAMFGIDTGMSTTDIVVKKVNIPKLVFEVYLQDYIEKHYNTKVKENGDYDFSIGMFKFDRNIHDLVNELIQLASNFKDGDRVYCRGRKLIKKEQSFNN